MRPTRSTRPARNGNPWPLIIGALVIAAGISAAAVVVSNDRRATEERRAADERRFDDLRMQIRQAELKAEAKERDLRLQREARERIRAMDAKTRLDYETWKLSK